MIYFFMELFDTCNDIFLDTVIQKDKRKKETLQKSENTKW